MSETIESVDTVTVDLGDLGPEVQARIDSGEYASASEVIRAGLQALDREEALFCRNASAEGSGSTQRSAAKYPNGGSVREIRT
jgi:putative addiction module CopG family antidote